MKSFENFLKESLNEDQLNEAWAESLIHKVRYFRHAFSNPGYNDSIGTKIFLPRELTDNSVDLGDVADALCWIVNMVESVYNDIPKDPRKSYDFWVIFEKEWNKNYKSWVKKCPVKDDDAIAKAVELFPRAWSYAGGSFGARSKQYDLKLKY